MAGLLFAKHSLSYVNQFIVSSVLNISKSRYILCYHCNRRYQIMRFSIITISANFPNEDFANFRPQFQILFNHHRSFEQAILIDHIDTACICINSDTTQFEKGSGDLVGAFTNRPNTETSFTNTLPFRLCHY